MSAICAISWSMASSLEWVSQDAWYTAHGTYGANHQDRRGEESGNGIKRLHIDRGTIVSTLLGVLRANVRGKI